MAAWAWAAKRAVRFHSDVPLATLDVALFASAYAITLLLRFDGDVPEGHWRDFGRFLPLALGLMVVSNVAWGTYGQVWRHASFQEARRLLAAAATLVVVLLSIEWFKANRLAPLSVVLLGTMLGTFFCAAVRFQSRLFSFRRRADSGSGLKVVVVGGRDKAAALVREMQNHPQMGFTPIGILDPDPRLHGRLLAGLKVEGGLDRLVDVALDRGAHLAVVAMSSVEADVVRQVASLAEEAGIALKIAPDIGERVTAAIALRDIRDVQIVDLLGRKEVVTDLDAVARLLRGRRVLITGAGGSIGSEIARQVAAFQPSELLLLDHDETHLHDVVGALPTPATSILGDIREADRVRQVFDRHRPQVVFHAAAHKHVPLLEDHPCEAANTNVLGTHNILTCARENRVDRVVFISTDKAVEPSNVMGATKRIGERLLRSEAPDGARWCAVRFGNVLGSRGSVIPTFMRQIQSGGPVTITDPRMTRYFMSIEEAVQLVLQSAALAEGGDVFVLDMGEPVRIAALAERMIRLSGRRVGADVEIVVTGVRPGEKLVEELHRGTEQLVETVHPSINRLDAPADDLGLGAHDVEMLRHLVAGLRDGEVRNLLFRLAGTPAPADAASALS